MQSVRSAVADPPRSHGRAERHRRVKKRALRVSKEQTNQKLEAMEAKINNITDMLQKLLKKEQS